MTGFEYTAAIGMLYEGQTEEGLKCITNIRNRYDGRKRSPFDEAECGHHYGRAMASWSALPALTGFNYSAVTGGLKFTGKPGKYFWSNGYAYGTAEISENGAGGSFKLNVLNGSISISAITIDGYDQLKLKQKKIIPAGREETFIVKNEKSYITSRFVN